MSKRQTTAVSAFVGDDDDDADMDELGGATLGAKFGADDDADEYDALDSDLEEEYSEAPFAASASAGGGGGAKLVRAKAPLSSRQRDETNRAMFAQRAALDEAAPAHLFDTVTYTFDAKVALPNLERANKGDASKIVLSVANGGLRKNVAYSNAEDATAEAHAHGACDLVDSITVSSFKTNLPDTNFVVNFPTVKALEREVFPLSEQTKDAKLDAPYGTVSNYVTKVSQNILARNTRQGVVAYAQRHPGMTTDKHKATAFPHPNGKDCYLLMDAPAVDHYNDHVTSNNLKLPLLDDEAKKRADGGGYVFLQGARDVVFNHAIPAAERASREHIGYSNVTDPSKFSMEFRLPPSSEMNADGNFVQQPVSFKDLVTSSITSLATSASASSASRATATLAKKALERPISLQGVVTIRYLKAHPNFKLAEEADA